MLRQLTIKNFAIIDDLMIDFNEGYNVFTGETGAGKSIIIDALGLLTGDRANASMVRAGTTKAFIEGVFEVKDDLKERISKIYDFESNLLVIIKEIDASGKSTVKINGRITTISTIKEIMMFILDIHSQSDNQYLLNKKNHLELLDSYGNKTITPIKNNYDVAYREWRHLEKELNELESMTFNQDQIDFLNFQIKEIKDANIQDGEVEELEIEQKRINQFEKLNEKYQAIIQSLDGEQGASTSLFTAKKTLESMSDDPLFNEQLAKVESIYYDLDEVIQLIKDKFGSIDFDEDRITEISNRIFIINKIKRKYGKNYSDIQEAYNNMLQKVSNMENIERNISAIKININEALLKLNKIGQELDETRKKVSKSLSSNIEKQLTDLYLEHAKFSVEFEKNDLPTATGISDAEFYVSLNPGQPLRPLIKVASGGEVSRLMLGLKVIFNSLFMLSVTVFDEIDTGVSGKVARSIGMKMLELSKVMQVICVTHLPQVASLGTHHYYVQKQINKNSTKTIVSLLDDKQRVIEIAKMLSGEEIPSESAILNAKSLLNTI